MMRKFLPFKQIFGFVAFFMLMLLGKGTFAQVTTSSIVGRVNDPKGEVVPGATVQAIHEPTGTNYGTVTKNNGEYTLPNLRVGGPYTLTVSAVGFATKKFENISVALGTPLSVNIIMEESSSTLNEVTVTAGKGDVISSVRNGSSTFIPLRQMQSLPTINRSVQDFTRLTPQANTAGSGVSFGGQNNRFNQFTIDGANATDAFGLTSSGTNGGQANLNPISIETIQEMQVVLSPYDVTYGGFTGGGINAVTKSGANDFHGSVYGQYQNEKFVGKSQSYNETITRNPYPEFKNQTFGASLSGPIVKNKLFFYLNGERFVKSTPLAFDPTVAGSGSRANKDSLEVLRQFMINNYNYDPGSYGAINNENKSTSLFGRLDWNINSKHTLTLRHNYINGSNDILSRTATSVPFSNTGYKFFSKSNSTVLELNSNFSPNASNVLRLTYNTVRDRRASNFFPGLTINSYDLSQRATITYNLGSENSSQANSLDQDVFTITDNFTLYKGKHTITFGTNNEFFSSKNVFLQGFYGNYTYGVSGTTDPSSISKFMKNTGLTSYNVGFSTNPDRSDRASANLRAAQLSVYAQDIWSMTDRFKLTYGLRIDMPLFFNDPTENPAVEAAFPGYKTSQMPKANPLFSPRVGFNWDVKGDASTQVRGGAGLFTGRLPFVWISNQFSNTGVTQINYSVSNTNAANIATLAGIKYNFNPNDPHAGAYIPASVTAAPPVINVIDRNFKFPQVFRANLAVDQKLGFWGLIGTLEGIYTKTLNNANYENLNLSENGEGSVTLGSTTRPLWTKRVTTAFTDVIKLKNTNQGYSYSLTAQVQKPYDRGWSGSIAYTYGRTKSLTDLTSSVAYSNWRFAYATNGLNRLDLANSNFDMGSRIIGSLSKEFKYAKNFATTITLIYTGQSGLRASYLYNRTITGDDITGSTNNTLVYVPASAAEANFADLRGGATAAEQWTNFQKFASENKFLGDNMGKNAARNGDRLPFEHHFDVRIAQDFIYGKHKLQVFFDVLNVGNMLQSKWGRAYSLSNQSSTLFTVLTSGSQTQNGTAFTPTAAKPALQFNVNNMNNIEGTYRPYIVSDFSSRWNAQIGARYSF